MDKAGGISRKKRNLVVRNMLRLIKHRGGDAVGVKDYDNVSLGHTRLSIVDSKSRAHQPFIDADSILSFNGEIYNHTELRDRHLKQKIISYSDTATLFGLLHVLPIGKVLDIIQGMYAFSFLDKKKNILSLTLDKFGIKPLYYVDTPGYFAWASEIKAFKALPRFAF